MTKKILRKTDIVVLSCKLDNQVQKQAQLNLPD